MSDKIPVIVIGAGVSGLSCGVRLQEYGFNVTILAKELHPLTTSSTAAAVWYPYKAQPLGRVLQWSRTTLEELYRLSEEPRAGVSLTDIVEVFQHAVEDPWWKEGVLHFRRTRPEELPAGYHDGYVAEVPLMNTAIYLPYLAERFRQGGGSIKKRHLSSVDEVLDDNPIVVNCSGLGARVLVKDQTLFPIRGQMITTDVVPTKRCLVDLQGPRGLSYIIPRADDCVLGGTAEEHSWNMEIDPKQSSDIISKCAALDPAFATSRIIDQKVGLRPGRPEVRLEAERMDNDHTVIHNYGHGGSGFTSSWGCANEVMNLAIKYSLLR